MHFAEPTNLILLWIVPIFIAIIAFSYRKKIKLMRLIAETRLAELLSGKYKKSRIATKTILIGSALALLVIALARPRGGFDWKDRPAGGVDIMVVLDLSSSMLADDLKPNRLERAKRELSDLLDMLQGDRVGVVAFAGASFVQCPLTRDYGLAKLLLSQLDTKLIPIQGTMIGEAIRRATDSLLKGEAADSEGKAIILITDGEDQGSSPIEASKEAGDKGIKIFTIGIGEPGGSPIPLPGGGIKKDASGQIVMSKLDEATLVQISENSGGIYVRSTSGDLDLEKIYLEGIRKNIDDQEYGTFRQKVWHEKFGWFLFFAILLLFIDFLVSPFKKYRAALAFLCLIPLCHENTSFAGPEHEAMELLKAKKFEEASRKFQEAIQEEPLNSQHYYNKAIADYLDSNFEEASKNFAQAAQSDDPKLKQDSFFNMGNSLVGQGKLEDALGAYKEALKLAPEDKQIKENMKWVTKQIEQKKQQQQQNQNNDNQDQDQDQQDSDQKQQQQQQNQAQNKDQQQSNQDQQQEQAEQSKDQQKGEQEQERQQKQAEQNKEEQQNNQDEQQEKQQQAQQEQDEQSQEEQQQQAQQDQGEQKDPSEEEEQQAQSDGEEESEENKDEQQAQDAQQESQEQNQEQQVKAPPISREMTEEEAKALLRSLNDDVSKYGRRPRFKRPERSSQNDW